MTVCVQLDDELDACREEASLTEDELEATRELVTVLQKHIDICQRQHDTQLVNAQSLDC